MRVCRAEPRSSSRLSLALVGLDPRSMAFLRVWWAQRHPRSALPPDVSWCLGWKRNPAAGLKGTESSHPLFPGHTPPPPAARLEWNSVWVAAGGSSALRASCRQPGRWRLAVGRAGLGERQKREIWEIREAGGRGLSWGVVSEGALCLGILGENGRGQ